MAEKKRSAFGQANPDRDEMTQSMGLDHRAPSLVAQDSPDDSQMGAPAEQVRRNRPKTKQ